METQEFDLPGVTFVGPASYRAATMLLAAKAFLSLLLGLTVTYAWVVLPQAGRAPPLHAACDAPVGMAPAGVARRDHPAALVMLAPIGRAQVCGAARPLSAANSLTTPCSTLRPLWHMLQVLLCTP